MISLALDFASACSSGDLVHLARNGDDWAISTLFLRFAPVLTHMARRSGIDSGLRQEVVNTFLGDIVLSLCDMKLVPSKTDAYVLRAFHNRLTDYHRDVARRDRMSRDATSNVAGSAEEAILSCCSEYALNAAAGPDERDGEAAPTTVRAMLDLILSPLNEPELALLGCLANQISTRDIAEWLSLSTATVKVRIHRLRQKLRRAAIDHARTLDPEQRAELAKYVPELSRPEK